MSNAPSDHGFIEEPADQASESKSNNTLMRVLGCLGCGGLGFVLLAIISAIALPSFLNQANKARESEAKTYIGSMNRGQQVHFLENKAFSPSSDALGIRVPATTENYSYSIVVSPDGSNVLSVAIPFEAPLKYYTGAVLLRGEGEELTTMSQICESSEPLTADPVLTSLGTIDCPPGSTPLK